jgi:hypothetical protein
MNKIKKVVVVLLMLVLAGSISACVNPWICEASGGRLMCATLPEDFESEAKFDVSECNSTFEEAKLNIEKSIEEGTCYYENHFIDDVETVEETEDETEECPMAADLGPWAPNADGTGENFEITCNETVCETTHAQLWWPQGSGQEWGTDEVSVEIPAGLSVEVQQGAGKGFEFSSSCSVKEIRDQIKADNDRRSTDTSFYGQVDIDDLIEMGLVKVRFDRRAEVNPTD